MFDRRTRVCVAFDTVPLDQTDAWLLGLAERVRAAGRHRDDGAGHLGTPAASSTAAIIGPSTPGVCTPNTFQLFTTATVLCAGRTMMNWPPKPLPAQTSVPRRS